MTEGAQQRVGFSAIEGREAKAEKIMAILRAAGRPLAAGQRVLDIGTGNGQIAAVLGNFAEVVTVDVVDQRTDGRELPFAVADRTLPFPDASFDLVVSNHVIEHTEDPVQHLREIRRVLKPDGIAYLATPNRWWPWEVHTRLPLLHLLPAALFSRLAMRLGRSREALHLMSLPALSRLAGPRFRVVPWHQRIVSEPARFHLQLPGPTRRLATAVPRPLLEASRSWQPTLIVLLYPR